MRAASGVFMSLCDIKRLDKGALVHATTRVAKTPARQCPGTATMVAVHLPVSCKSPAISPSAGSIVIVRQYDHTLVPCKFTVTVSHSRTAAFSCKLLQPGRHLLQRFCQLSLVSLASRPVNIHSQYETLLCGWLRHDMEMDVIDMLIDAKP